MPKKPKSPCRFRGCPELTEEKYCEKHKKLKSHYYININVISIPTSDMETGGEGSDNFISKGTLSVSCANEKIY